MASSRPNRVSVPSLDDTLRAAGLLTLGQEPTAEAVQAALRKLGELSSGSDPLARETLRAGALRLIKPLGWRAAAVDAALGTTDRKALSSEGPGSAIALSDPEPWPEPVNGADVLGDLVRTFARHLAQPEGAATAEALWVLHAHAQEAWSVSPVLGITSASKRCGKTTLETLISALVPRPLPASNITAAALFRAVEAFRPTLLVDEADTFLTERDELRGILNSGHTRAGAKVVRTVGDDHQPRLFSTWCPKVVAMIGELPDTLADRSVIIRLRRRRPDETVERLRLDRLGGLEPLRRRCARWTSDHLDDLRDADPDVPEALHDRARDNWRPLLSIADAAGGPWPERARRAALLLSGDADADDGDVGVVLLHDLRDLFARRATDRLSSSEIVAALTQMEERPWPEWRRGHPLTMHQLARLLDPYGVRPRQMKAAGEKIRGYDLCDLADSFQRYLPQPVPSVPSSNGAGKVPGEKRYPDDGGTAFANGENLRRTTKVPVVPAQGPLSGDVEPYLWAGGPEVDALLDVEVRDD